MSKSVLLILHSVKNGDVLATSAEPVEGGLYFATYWKDYDSDSNDYIDKLVDAYRNMQNMFDARPFETYDATFDAYDANNANLDAAVATWYAALTGKQNIPADDERSEEAFEAAIKIAETAMKDAYAFAIRTQDQHNKRRRSD